MLATLGGVIHSAAYVSKNPIRMFVCSGQS